MTAEESTKYQMPFGKYKGTSLGTILAEQPTYITEFLASIKDLREPLKRHVTVVLEHWNETNEQERNAVNDVGGTLLDR